MEAGMVYWRIINYDNSINLILTIDCRFKMGFELSMRDKEVLAWGKIWLMSVNIRIRLYFVFKFKEITFKKFYIIKKKLI